MILRFIAAKILKVYQLSNFLPIFFAIIFSIDNKFKMNSSKYRCKDKNIFRNLQTISVVFLGDAT